MSSSSQPSSSSLCSIEPNNKESVPGLGFKDKEKALDTLKILKERDPDYQRLAIKGLLGRAKRTLTLTKDKEKVEHITAAIGVFENWLEEFEKSATSKEIRPYLPLTTIEMFQPLVKHYALTSTDDVESSTANAFLEAYRNAGGDYKALRTVTSPASTSSSSIGTANINNADENGMPATAADEVTTWDITRNRRLKELHQPEHRQANLWRNNAEEEMLLPTVHHLRMILWAYSPEASKIRNNFSQIEKKIAEIIHQNNADDAVGDDMDEVDRHEAKRNVKKRSQEENNLEEQIGNDNEKNTDVCQDSLGKKKLKSE